MSRQIKRSTCIAFLSSALAVGTISAAEINRQDARINALIAKLHGIDDEHEASSLTRQLAAFRQQAMPALIVGLKSPDAATRTWCARAMTEIVGGYGDYSGRDDAATGGLPLVEALRGERDGGAKWYMVQAIGKIQPEADRAIPLLVESLKGRPSVRYPVLDALGEYGPKADGAKPTLIELLPDSESPVQTSIMTTLRKIGLDEEDLAALSRLRFRDEPEGAREIFDQLVEHPELELAFLKAHPKLLSTLPKNHLALVDLFSYKDAQREPLRAYILEQENLPEFIRVDRDRDESYGHVMTWPRKPHPWNCFPQRAQLVKFVGDTAEIGVFRTDPDYQVRCEEGFALVKREGKWGFIDESGKIVVPPQFERAEDFSEGMAIVWENDKAGYIRRDGSYLKEPQYDGAYRFKHGLGTVRVKGKYGLINAEGEWVLKPTYSGALNPTEDGFCGLTSDGWYHRLDKSGKVIRISREIDWYEYDWQLLEPASPPAGQRRGVFRRRRS